MTTQTVAVPTAGQTAPPTASGNAPPPMPYPFPVGVYEPITQDYDKSVAQLTSQVQLPIHEVTPTGWISGIWYYFQLVTAGNSAAAAFTPDGTFNLIAKMTFYDLGGRPVIGPIGGYDWMTLVKFGGYLEVGDPRSDLSYNATAGTGSTGGSCAFMLFLPFEFCHRDGIGTLQNESDPGWKVELWMEASGTFYATSPTTLGTLRVRAYPLSYTEPTAAAPGGKPFAQTPPVPGTMQYWRSENESQAAGAMEYDTTNGIGFPIRNRINKSVDASAGTRSAGDADWPDPCTLTYGNVTLYAKGRQIWITQMSRDFGLTSTTADTGGGRENGVYPEWYTKDFFMKPGAELRYKYLQTLVNTVLRIQGSNANAMTLFILTNWIVPSTASYYSLLPGAQS